MDNRVQTAGAKPAVRGRPRKTSRAVERIIKPQTPDGPLENQASIHFEDRLTDYITALVKGGRCLSKNSYVRGLVAADYAWGDDPEWSAMVAEGIRQYEKRFGARL